MTSEFSFFSKPHPLLPPVATFYLPSIEGVTDDNDKETFQHWGQSGVPEEFLYLSAPQPDQVELSLGEFSEDEIETLSTQSISSLDVYSNFDFTSEVMAGSSEHLGCPFQLQAHAPRGDCEVGQVIGPAGSLKELLGLPFLHEAEELSLTVHRVGRTLLIDHPLPRPSPAYSSSSSDNEDYDRSEGDQKSAKASRRAVAEDIEKNAATGAAGSHAGVRERQRRRRVAQRTKKKLGALEKVLSRHVPHPARAANLVLQRNCKPSWLSCVHCTEEPASCPFYQSTQHTPLLPHPPTHPPT
jgi:hypothetical protein